MIDNNLILKHTSKWDNQNESPVSAKTQKVGETQIIEWKVAGQDQEEELIDTPNESLDRPDLDVENINDSMDFSTRMNIL